MRSYWVFRASEILVNIYFNTRYKVHHEGSLPKGPFVLLPKHQKMIDILLEGNLVYRTTGKQPYYIMRGFPFPLNEILHLYGGILVARPKDLKKGKITKEQAQAINEATTEKAISQLKKGETIVIHPEGTRHNKQMGQIRIKPNSLLEKIIRAQLGVPFVPLGIEYAGRDIWLRTGSPYHTTDANALEAHLTQEIPKLSNI